MVARYKKKRLAEMMSSDESRCLDLEGSERMRAKTEVRKLIKEVVLCTVCGADACDNGGLCEQCLDEQLSEE